MQNTPRPISPFRASAKNTKSGSTSGWTPERRAAAAERARKSKPWLHSTGPRTPEGKARCARNALKHGYYSAAARRERAYYRALRAFAGHANALLRLENYLVKRLGLPYNRVLKDCGRFSGYL